VALLSALTIVADLFNWTPNQFYFTTVEAVFVIATNSILAWSGLESVSHVNILKVSSGTEA
jgi:hypothetical protein